MMEELLFYWGVHARGQEVRATGSSAVLAYGAELKLRGIFMLALRNSFQTLRGSLLRGLKALKNLRLLYKSLQHPLAVYLHSSLINHCRTKVKSEAIGQHASLHVHHCRKFSALHL